MKIALRTAGLIAIALASASAQDSDAPMLSGISLSYIEGLAGGISAGSVSEKWDSTRRFELQLRDYYFAQQSHHPFYEVGVLLERHSLDGGAVSIDAEAWGLKAAIGTAIPYWRSQNTVGGIAPQLSMHIAKMSLDVTRPGGLSSSDSAFRYGLSTGVDGWMLLGGRSTLGIGPFLSYWRSMELSMVQADGSTADVHPSGWDLGVRLVAGIVF